MSKQALLEKAITGFRGNTLYCQHINHLSFTAARERSVEIVCFVAETLRWKKLLRALNEEKWESMSKRHNKRFLCLYYSLMK